MAKIQYRIQIIAWYEREREREREREKERERESERRKKKESERWMERQAAIFS